ncbi:MAG: PilN domain-containing protein [Chloroflexi bacterium]|nr:PilN domain-containing protein [Chloroflexota bacterium]
MQARLALSRLFPRKAPRSRVPELNLLPEQFRRRVAPTLRQWFYLAILFEVLIAVLVYQSKGQASVQGAQQMLTSFRAKEDIQEQRIQRLQASLVQLQTELQQLKAGRQELLQRNTDWALLLDELFKSAPVGTEILTVRQVGQGITISGLSKDIDTLSEFRTSILNSKQATSAVLTSIQQDPRQGSVVFTMSLRLR